MGGKTSLDGRRPRSSGQWRAIGYGGVVRPWMDPRRRHLRGDALCPPEIELFHSAHIGGGHGGVDILGAGAVTIAIAVAQVIFEAQDGEAVDAAEDWLRARCWRRWASKRCGP